MEERVQKIISNAGYCSRRKAEEFIEKGKVTVNGKTIKLGDKADIEKDEIYIGSTQIEKSKPIYIMLNKPKGYEVTLNPEIKGLLLLTNDGNFANKITHPRYEKEKTYYVKLDKRIEERDIKEIERGLHMADGVIKGKIKVYQKDQIEITIHEGKKWIIKRMFFKLGYYVTELSRVKIGNLRMDVKIGKWRFLNPKEVNELMK